MKRSGHREPSDPMTSKRTGPMTWEPLEKFGHPTLKEAPHEGERHRNAWAWLVRKSCAGLANRWKADPEDVREAMRTGRWNKRTSTTFQWVAEGESMIMIPHWYEGCAISIYEIARSRMHLFPERDTWALFLNVWARNPDEPKPWTGMWGRQADYIGSRCVVKDRIPW